ncbi:AMP-binding protein [Streptomyces sp. NPDC059680]|uniref:AMP-binding protein n=1 Tax=Streptomyces sp. NPDC059680 TaxID=3346904 RepID=UPI0036BCD2F7
MSISGLIEQQVQEGPDAIAVHYPQHADGRGAHLTYRELSRAANRLAAHLRARGIGHGDRVVTSLRPGPEMVTAFLGIVRAGAAYVPVDPAAPAERRRLIVRDSAAAAVLAEGAGDVDYAGLDTMVVALDAEAAEIARRSDALPEQTTGPDDAFSVRYTPGTTGTPEGVVVPHRAVLDLVRSTDHLRLTPADAVAQAAGPAFDAVTFEVWTALTAGARLVGLGADTLTDPGRFQDAVRTHGISVILLTTAQFSLVARERPAAFAPLRTVLFGGEPCDPRRVREVFAAGAPGRLLHVHGAAGTTTFTTWHEVAEPAEGDRTIPAGRPIGTTTAVVVDADDTPVAPGGFGEDRFTGTDGPLYRTGGLVPADPAPAATEEDAQMTEWKEMDEVLHDDAAGFGAGLAGWNSSYDALPIPLEHLREWRNATLDRIRELPRRRVLEIGAGTGLLMAHLAHDEEVHEYWATGFSPAVVAALTRRTEADPVLKEKVRLDCRGAEDTSGLPVGHFDTIVVNSVIQYFPSLARLRTVIERALPLLAPGGSLFLGDLRNLDLAHCFQTGIALARPGAAQGDREALRRTIDQQVATEAELLLSPALFDALARDLPAVRAVDVRAKRGRHHNELTRYRYDAVLSTAEPVADLTTAPVLRWDGDVAGIPGVEHRLTTARPAVLRLAGVPNRRVHDEYTATQSLFDPLESIDLAPQDAPAPDPETLCETVERLGYRALPTWGESPDLLDIVVVDPGQVGAGALTGVYAAPVTEAESCANTPTAGDRTVDREVALRDRLQERLPDHMTPSAPTSPEALLMNADGEADREALPAPARTADRPGTQPGTPVQEIVRDLFAEVLGLPRHMVHAETDFFRSGGHSPAAARLLSRVRETLGADPGSRALSDAPTPAAFAALVGDAPAAVTGPGGTAGCSAEFSLRLRGALDTRALEAALVDLGRRHEALRNSRLGSAGTRLRALAADDHLLELALPADAVDPWSHLPLAAELARAYGARATGDTPHRSPAGLDAAPRAVFGDLPPTPLPGSAQQAGGTSYGTLETELDAELHGRLTRLAAEHGTTLFMVVHAALAALLNRLGATGPVTVATAVPARDTAALREAVGPYGRVLALTVDTSGDPAFTELLRRVRERDLAAYRDAEAALAALPGGIALTVLQECAGRFEAAGLSVEAEHHTLPVPATDLGLTLTERQGPSGAPAGITVSAAFRHETVGETAAASLTGQLNAVLRSVLEAPATPLSRLRLLPGPAAGSGVWAGADVQLAEQDVASLFAAQVARTPGTLALDGLDYAELDARSDLLAHALIEHRAGPGTCVLTALSSPAGFAVAAIAVAKTGAALLPVDPSLDLAESLRPAVLLLDETADLLLPAVPGAARLVRGDAADRLPPAGHWPVTEADRTRPLRSDDPVLLLPGEDGTVAVGGEAVTAATPAAPADAAWLVRGYPDGDAAIGLLSALVCGARVHVPDGSVTRDVPHEVLGWLRRQGARVVLGGADDVLCALVSLARTEGAELTVSGGWAEGRLVVEHVPGAPARPAPGHRAYLLDSLLRPVAPGRTGSLYIAGAGVAQGYVGAPGASGGRFLPDPFGGPDGTTARMWRTGRAARLDEDGNLRVLDGPAHDDPFADAFATFVVLADATGHRALWPATAAVPEGWYETHTEDLYEFCLDHINDHLGEPF